MKREQRPEPTPPEAARVDEGGGEEPPFSPEELREAAALCAALERGEDSLASALRAAWAPAPLDETQREAILARALGESEAAPTESEIEEAASLREEIERAEGFREATSLLGDLKAAYHPPPLPAARNEELIERALSRASAREKPRLRVLSGAASPSAEAARPGNARRRRILPVTMAALSGVAALAAGVALLLGQLNRAAAPGSSIGATATLIHARSTDGLFEPTQKFELGAQSARIDRIASARASDLRQNRFAAWGVR